MKLLRRWLPLTAGQRLLVLASLVLTAVILHFACCGWQFSGQANRPLIGFSRGLLFSDFVGIVHSDEYGSLIPLLFGLLVPFTLIAASGLLGMKWLRDQPMSFQLSIAQRKLVIASLLGAALLLHFAVCEWAFMGSSGRGRGLMVLRSSTEPRIYTGIFDKTGAPPLVATVMGVVCPLLLIATAPFLAMGWRRIDRVAARQCMACGFPLASPPLPACTECGAVAPPSATA